MTRKPTPFRRRPQGGFSLLEVLITIVILSFGLLGMAQLTGMSLQTSKISQFQGIALQLANDYADRMRGNPNAVAQGFYDMTDVYNASAGGRTVPACNPCSAADIAAIDRAEWTNNLRERLPAGGAWVTHRGTSVRIWILWQEPGSRTAPDPAGAPCPAAALPANPPADSAPLACFHYPARI